ncbi:CAP domain-containing protein [Boeremia exigua]|uniref:CAP domain-containing protein n=1 Tax=Boeremia exigua TaxID=749465 RepID=UPI001E8D694B|nr:CAP domain-containing protein [Boeremia exigua]KAH6642771.1 CAP domain-containing protein [Boeremia exigua]
MHSSTLLTSILAASALALPQVQLEKRQQGNPGPSNVPPPANGAPVDPGHTPGPQQAFLTVNSGLAYRNSILFHHNQARANHGSQPLVWNETVAATAKITADTCIFEHSVPDNVRQGQNLYTVSGDYFNVTAAITESWYKGEFPFMRNYYGATDIPSNVFGQVGHLTQVVWNGTTSVGCYSLDCGNRMVVFGERQSSMNKYTVCNYWPAGNVRTQYALNVGRPRSNTDLGNYAD